MSEETRDLRLPPAVDLDALDKLREAATPGPWTATTERANGGAYIDPPRAVNAERNPGPAWVGEATIHADAALIVGAVNALPDLIAEARKYRALREAVEGLAGHLDHVAVTRLDPLHDIAARLRAVVTTVGGTA